VGYRSEWQLLIAGPEDKVNEFTKWMEEKKGVTTKQSPYSFSEESVWAAILDVQHKEKEQLDKNTIGIAFGYDSTKCYQPWDRVIDCIFEKAEEEESIEVAYGRLGEDPGDNDFRDTQGRLYVSFVQSLTPPFDNY